ncbi:hypothetical protein [Mycolicibacterium mageritense]|nr:hypothetical protein [Mycolicibacterium mageritense]
MRISATWGADAAHVHLARWQVRVLERWAAEDDAAEEHEEAGHG